MKKSSVFIQIIFAALWILAAILLIVVGVFGNKNTTEITILEAFIGATGLTIIGVIKIFEIYKTQKRFQKLFQKNEQDKIEIEEMRKEILK